MKRNRLVVGLAALLAVMIGLLAGGDVSAAALRATIDSNLALTFTTAVDVGEAKYDAGSSGNFQQVILEGTGLNQANKAFLDTAATTTSYDLDSTLTGPLGSVTFGRVVGWRITCPAANAGAVSISGDFILTKYLVPGGDTLSAVTVPVCQAGAKSSWQHWAPSATGYVVTATTGDVLTVTVSGSDSFTIHVLGS